MYARHTTGKESAETSEASQEGTQGGTQPSSRMNAPTASDDKVNSSPAYKFEKEATSASDPQMEDAALLSDSQSATNAAVTDSLGVDSGAS